MEDKKTLAKVTGLKLPPQKWCRPQDPNNLRNFFGQRCMAAAPAGVPKTRQAVPSKDLKEQGQEAAGPATIDNTVCTNTVTIFNNTLTHILWLPCRLPMGRLPHNCHVITTNQWILQVVRGYRLELTAPLNQVSASYHGNTCQSESGVGGTAETASQGSKSAPAQAITSAGPQEGWLIQTSGEPEATQSVLDNCPLQDGEPGNNGGPTEGRRLDGLHRLEGLLSAVAALPVPLLTETSIACCPKCMIN